jgi:hypothetical protein
MMRETEFNSAIASPRSPLPHARFAVYRNNVAAGLANALKVRFPVTNELVGGEFFRAMAAVYAEASKPASPVLIFYGEDFPEFIAGFPPASTVPYLADMARLENLWWRAYHAPDKAPAPKESLAQIPRDRLGNLKIILHPSVGLVQSPFAIGSIWHAHRGGKPMGTFAATHAERTLVSRPRDDVEVRILGGATFHFLHALAHGVNLVDAVEQGTSSFAEFDTQAQLALLFDLNLVSELCT